MWEPYLRHRYINESLGCRVNKIQELHYSGSVVRYCSLLTVVHEFVHSTRTQGGSHGFCDGLTCIDIRNYLRFSLTRVSALTEQYYLPKEAEGGKGCEKN